MADLEAPEKDITEKSQLNEETEPKNDCYTKEELLELSDTPCWNMTRRILLVLFWLCWFGMIAWSIVIVVYAPKCKKEPDQAWFTKGAIAKYDCSVPIEEITAKVSSIEAGQYKGIMVDGCIPPMTSNMTLTSDQAVKVANLTRLAAGKDIKVIFSIDVGDVDDLTGEIWEGVTGNLAGDGYILRNAAELTISMNISDTTLFIEGQQDIPDNAFYYKALDAGDPLGDARTWVEATMNINATNEDVDIDVWSIINGTETLWEASSFGDGENPSAEFIMTAILPGGFIVPFEPIEEDSEPKFVQYGKEWRRNYESLRAISGSIMRWFVRNAGFSRKFDLQSGVEVALNLGEEDVEIAGIRGRLEAAEDTVKEKIYPAEDEENLILAPKSAQVFIVK